MGYTETQKAAINSFRKKFSTNTKTEIDERIGTSKPLTAEQMMKLEAIRQKINLLPMCRA